MKKKLKGEQKNCTAVKIYRNDIEEIIELMKAAFAVVEICDEEFEYDSIDELIERRGEQIKNLTISSAVPSLSLKLSTGEIKLVRDGETGTMTPFVQIQEILRRRQRKVLAVILNPILVALYFGLILLVLNFHQRLPWSDSITILVSAPLMVGLGICFSGHRLGMFSRILLLNEHQEQSFWKANKDKIYLLIIGALIGSVLTKLVP